MTTFDIIGESIAVEVQRRVYVSVADVPTLMPNTQHRLRFSDIARGVQPIDVVLRGSSIEAFQWDTEPLYHSTKSSSISCNLADPESIDRIIVYVCSHFTARTSETTGVS